MFIYSMNVKIVKISEHVKYSQTLAKGFEVDLFQESEDFLFYRENLE